MVDATTDLDLMILGAALHGARLVTGGSGVAVGETSGAVVEALGIRDMDIMGEIAPGVPWTQTTGADPIALALKSGNFGDADIFRHAFDVLERSRNA